MVMSSSTSEIKQQNNTDYTRVSAYQYHGDLSPHDTGPVAQLVSCTVSCRTTFKWCEFDPRDVQQLFDTPFCKVSLWALGQFAVGQFAVETVRRKKRKKNLTEPNLT